MKILIDMNLSPEWVEIFKTYGISATHWSIIGAHDASDSIIMKWAKSNGYIVFTHDLDFGTLLALTHEEGPSVLQVRTQDIMPEVIGRTIINLCKKYEEYLISGALIVVDKEKSRVKILPL